MKIQHRNTHPQCPQCHATISYFQRLFMWNPWRVSCPACRAKLEMSPLVKLVSILGMQLWLAIVGVAIYMQEAGQWTTANSLTYLAAAMSILLGISIILWPKTKLFSKNDDANEMPHDSSPSELILWCQQGGRTALMMSPRWQGLRASAWIIAAVVLLNLLITVIMQRLYIVGPATFYWRAIFSGWITIAFLSWLCYLMRQECIAESSTDIAPSAAHLITMVLTQWVIMEMIAGGVFAGLVHAGIYTEQRLGVVGLWVVWLIPGIWMLLAQLVLLLRSGDRRTGTKIAAVLGIVVVAAVNYGARPNEFWYADESGDKATQAKQLTLTQELMESQQQLLVQRLANLKPQRANVVDLYGITYAPYQEAVFRRESEMVDQVMNLRFDAQGHTLQLVNDPETTDRLPWATPLNLRRSIQQFAKLMDRDEDILFIHLTSHGASDGELASSFWPLEVRGLTPSELKKWLDDAGIKHRVISISACYSGSWIGTLENENTLVMTAADAEHTSYGCGSKSELTYFGRAMYDEQLRTHTFSFEQAHKAARSIIQKREVEAGKDDGYSNPQIKVGAAIKTRLNSLEARLRSGGNVPPVVN